MFFNPFRRHNLEQRTMPHPTNQCLRTNHHLYVCQHSTSIRQFLFSSQSGLEHNVILRPYESYRYDGRDLEDLSGTLIRSDKPVTVISGCASVIPNHAAVPDGILSQLLPTKSWGSLYHIFPFESLNSGFVYRVFASNISTALNISNGNVTVIPPGQFYEGDISGDVVISLRTDQRVQVFQYMKSNRYNNPFRGDPSMLVVPSASSYTHDVIFPVFEYTHTIHTYYINVVSECENIDGLVFDDEISVASWDNITTDDQTMCCVRSSVSPGYHSITHADKSARFFVSVYAICNCDSSYAYSVGDINAQGKYLIHFSCLITINFIRLSQ